MEAPLLIPPYALPRELLDALDREGEELGVERVVAADEGREALAELPCQVLVEDAGRLPLAGELGRVEAVGVLGRVVAAPVLGRVLTAPVLGRAAPVVPDELPVPELQPRAWAVVADGFAPDLLRRA